ncbi:hypothetical protein LRS11_21320 [Pseudomonas sp. J452]|uniref:hypothetical protein n=1 Tax=Pseudomonas sp. J452 TaxID=2898441 RepID=UPI0021AE21EF|nr:hypothetical protein [Pseudomonas sp. J452]UUY08302.1 hypothetical protein LRS11_21320 [Pseudomonas sp. J452]
MKAVLIAALAALLVNPQAHAQGSTDVVDYVLDIGAAVKTMSALEIAPGRSSLSIVAEGAGKISTAGETVRFHAMCAIVDTQEGKKITAGSGDCELTSLGGAKLYARFQTLPGTGDRGHLTFSGGTREFATFSGSLPVQVTVNPLLVGKLVFFLETLQPADSKED